MIKDKDYNLTGCCALIQLRGDNKTSNKEIKNFINLLKKQQTYKWIHTRNTGAGATCIFVIVCPDEQDFEKKLIHHGFNLTHEFERRNGYPDGILKMYTLNIK